MGEDDETTMRLQYWLRTVVQLMKLKGKAKKSNRVDNSRGRENVQTPSFTTKPNSDFYDYALIGHARYINILEWLRGFRVKIAHLSSFFCPSIPKRNLDTKKTTPNIEVWPERIGAMLDCWYIKRGLLKPPKKKQCHKCGLVKYIWDMLRAWRAREGVGMWKFRLISTLNGIRYDALDSITLYNGRNVCLCLWSRWGEFTTWTLSFSICLPRLDVVFQRVSTQMQEGVKNWTFNRVRLFGRA